LLRRAERSSPLGAQEAYELTSQPRPFGLLRWREVVPLRFSKLGFFKTQVTTRDLKGNARQASWVRSSLGGTLCPPQRSLKGPLKGCASMLGFCPPCRLLRIEGGYFMSPPSMRSTLKAPQQGGSKNPRCELAKLTLKGNGIERGYSMYPLSTTGPTRLLCFAGGRSATL
jgi:hypothetical protein